MNLRQIEIFRAVMLAGSVTDAARLLHVSQPGVSRMLGHIELQLGFSLFERSRGRLRPTPEAQSLYAEVDRVYQGVQRVDEKARDLKNGGGLSLRVLASPSTALEIVPQAVSAMVARFPTARIYMETQLVREMVGQLVRSEADVAVSTLPIDNALLASEVVGRWSLACVFRNDHAFAGRRSVSLREVMNERLIAFSPDTPQGQVIAQWWAQNNQVPHAQIEVRSGQVACSLAACGAGVAIVDELTARAWSRDKLGFCSLGGEVTHDVFMVRHANAAQSILMLAFHRCVKEAFRLARRMAR
jgi:DNA-binding transcriptional LysR family regulator